MKARRMLQCFAFQRSKETINVVSYQLTKRKRSSLIVEQIQSNLVYVCMRRKFEAEPTKMINQDTEQWNDYRYVSHERKKKRRKEKDTLSPDRANDIAEKHRYFRSTRKAEI